MKSKIENFTITILILYVLTTACEFSFGVDQSTLSEKNVEDLIIDPNFDFGLDEIVGVDEEEEILTIYTVMEEVPYYMGKIIGGTGRLQIPNSIDEFYYHVLPNDLLTSKAMLNGKNNKMVICHIPPGNPENAHTIEIAESAWPAHRDNHGDSEGACDTDSFDDTDGDGVSDYIDEFPNDSMFAYTSYYPASNEMATLLFEDMWPQKGDYDFNDFVLYYNLRYKKNARNKIVEIDYKYKIAAIGGIKNSSFFVRLLNNEMQPLAHSIIENVSGADTNQGFVNVRANGTELGTEEAVIPIIDNTRNAFPGVPSNQKINVIIGEPVIESDTSIVSIRLSTPFAENEIYFDPFLIVDFDRELEVHLPSFGPTEIAENSSYFGTEDDASDLNKGIYYRNQNHFPWVLNIPREIVYPKENADFSITYNEFSEWAESRGNRKRQWYYQQEGKYKPNRIFPRGKGKN